MFLYFPPTEFAVLRWTSYSSAERTLRMFLAHLVKGRHLNDCDATSWYTDRLKAAAKALPESKDCFFAARPAISKGQLCQLVRTCSLRDKFALFAALR